MPSTEPASAPAPATSLTVLVIDDEPQIRRIVRTALQGPTTSIVEAKDGGSALDLAATERPQLVVLDLGLPAMSVVAGCAPFRRKARAALLLRFARDPEAEKGA